MKKSEPKILFSIICFLACFSLSAQSNNENKGLQSWSLDSCISYARNNNIQVLKSALSTEEAKVNLKEAKAALFPSLTFSSSQNVSFQKDAEKSVIYNGSYTLDANVTLFNGGANINTIKKQGLSVDASNYNYLATSNDIELSIIKAYYQILYAHESVTTNKEIVNSSLKQLERSKALLDAGTINKVEYAQVESQYISDKYQLVVAQTSEEDALLSLKKLLEIDTSSAFAINLEEAGLSELDIIIPDKADVENIALTTLPEIKAAQTDIKISKLSESIAKAERYPTLSLGGSIGTGHSSALSTNFGNQLSNGLSEVLSLRISVPILNNRSTKSKIERAQIASLNAELSLENTQKEISNAIATIHLDAISAQSRYDAASAKVKAAQESYNLISEKFQLGMQNAVDILVEKNTLLSAIQEKLQAKYTALLDLKLLNFYQTQGERNN
ncbi:MAG: TolC family protein [Bacteroidales bacterium]|nr:TolC family protein [Bacteroidales bacterium]